MVNAPFCPLSGKAIPCGSYNQKHARKGIWGIIAQPGHTDMS